MTNQLHKYLFSDRLTRLQTVFLEEAWQQAFEHRDYPEPVQTLLGELTAAAVLLAANLKMQGSLILQAQGDGPVSLLVVECTSTLEVRATVSLKEGVTIDPQADFKSLLNPKGEGRLVVILEPRAQDSFKPYQGIVPLEGNSIAEALQSYMQHSEQLDTQLCLAANHERATGMLLQRLPATEQANTQEEDSWARNQPLFATLKPEELLANNNDTLIKRLFWQEDLLQLPAEAVRWHCPCTRERVSNMLKMLGEAEIQDILKEQGKIEVACQFCGAPYTFDVVDCAQLFHPNSSGPTSQKLH